MATYFDRYSEFRYNGKLKPLPNLKIDTLASDKNLIYKVGKTRLDKVSDDYYNSPYYNWLIMLANPEFGGLEFNIPDQAIIRVAFPFESAIDRYITAINKYKSLYGG